MKKKEAGSGVMHSVKGVFSKGKDAITKFAGGLLTTKRVEIFKKNISIDLPHGGGSKVYSHLVRYKPFKCKQDIEPVVSITIKTSGQCWHEDTHFFVRFAKL